MAHPATVPCLCVCSQCMMFSGCQICRLARGGCPLPEPSPGWRGQRILAEGFNFCNYVYGLPGVCQMQMHSISPGCYAHSLLLQCELCRYAEWGNLERFQADEQRSIDSQLSSLQCGGGTAACTPGCAHINTATCSNVPVADSIQDLSSAGFR